MPYSSKGEYLPGKDDFGKSSVEKEKRKENSENKRRVTVWWEAINGVDAIFYCPHCKEPVTRINGFITTIIPGDANRENEGDVAQLKVLKTPQTTKCKGRMYKRPCPYIYVFQGVAQNA